MKHLYGEFGDAQFEEAKQQLRKSIFFLLLLADPNTKSEYSHIDTDKAFVNLLLELDGLNRLLGEPKELVSVISLLEEARVLYGIESFDFPVYRKLILDAGSKVLRIKKGG